jgi:hypothetical protein
MTPGGTVRSTARQRALGTIAAAAVAVSALSGCTGAAGVDPTPTPSGSEDASPDRSVAPSETCAQLIDINTLLVNGEAALATGRVAQQELDSMARLAGRMAHRVDVAPDTELAVVVTELQSAAGPYKTGGAMLPVDPASDAWTTAIDRAHDECTRAGVEFYVEMWTGG